VLGRRPLLKPQALAPVLRMFFIAQDKKTKAIFTVVGFCICMIKLLGVQREY